MDPLLNLNAGDTSVPTFLLVALLTICFTVAALWMFLPFAVFGIKTAIRDLIKCQKETNEKLDEIRMRLDDLDPKRPPHESPVAENFSWMSDG